MKTVAIILCLAVACYAQTCEEVCKDCQETHGNNYDLEGCLKDCTTDPNNVDRDCNANCAKCGLQVLNEECTSQCKLCSDSTEGYDIDACFADCEKGITDKECTNNCEKCAFGITSECHDQCKACFETKGDGYDVEGCLKGCDEDPRSVDADCSAYCSKC